MELVCPAGSLPALKAAVDQGADAVYIGFRDATNARNFLGLNFGAAEATKGIAYAHNAGVKVFVAANTYAQPGKVGQWRASVDRAVDLGVDAMIMADAGLMRYAAERYPALRLHLSVQGSATTPVAIRFMQERFAIQRVILPRVLSLAQVRRVLSELSDVEVEVFGFGSLCVMVEGRCMLSSYLTGESPNTRGVCSPAKAVRWEETADGREVRLNRVLIDRYGADQPAGYPVLCKGRFAVDERVGYALEEPTSLSVLDILPQLMEAGVAAIKIEGRQRSPAYVAEVVAVMRAALDQCLRDPSGYRPEAKLAARLDRLSEGRTHTLGALERTWL